MSYQRNTSIRIKGSELSQNRHYDLHIILNNKKHQIIKGTVYNQKGKPSVGAIIQVTQISNTNNTRNILGYSYTDEKGKYLFAIQALPYMRYEITVYSPLA